MTIKTDVPVVIPPDAAARIAQLGIQPEVEQMLDHTKHTVPDLEAIEIELWDDEFEPGQPHLSINAWRPGCSASLDDYAPQRELGSWLVRTFSPDVARWVSFDLFFRDEHGR